MAVSNTSTNTVDSKANKRIRATTTRTTARGSDMTQEKPMAWLHYTRPLERRLAHLINKKNQNGFDKHEAAALRHVLEIVKQPQKQPLTEEVINRDFYGRIDFVRQVEAAHDIK